ncbi:MAG: chloride channel protein, partial [Anaerolineae bacterium]|nr:chloride channel protein [Anaerolineae bacterium]
MLDTLHRDLIRIVGRLRTSENLLLLILAVVLGIATSGGVWLFHRVIDLSQRLFAVGIAQNLLGRWLGGAGIVIALALAGAVVGGLATLFVAKERHHGVAAIMESVALGGGRLRYQQAPIKALLSAISLGAGASVGPEDPSVQIGANLGSFLGQYLNLSEDRVRMLVSAGVASAVAAAFKAPIAGVFFSLEVILGEFTTASVGVVVLSAVMSSAAMAALEGSNPELGSLTYALGGPLEIPLYIPLGLLLVPFAVLFIRIVYWQHDLWHGLERIPLPLRTALAGVMVGCVGMFLPQILGTGRESMAAVLSGESQVTIAMLLLLGIAKLLMTSVSLGGGFQGGVFAPSLFVGTMIGGAFGRVVTQFFDPAMVGDPQAYAIAGMAGMMAGVLRAPITAILLVFELTNDYRLILPIMLTTTVCTIVADRLEPHGIYSLGLWRKGIRLQRGRDVDVMRGIRTQDVMRTPAPTISEHASLQDLRDTLWHQKTRALCVIDDQERLCGIVTLTDLQRAYATEQPDLQLTIGAICGRDIVTATADETLDAVITKMNAHDFM